MSAASCSSQGRCLSMAWLLVIGKSSKLSKSRLMLLDGKSSMASRPSQGYMSVASRQWQVVLVKAACQWQGRSSVAPRPSQSRCSVKDTRPTRPRQGCSSMARLLVNGMAARQWHGFSSMAWLLVNGMATQLVQGKATRPR